MQQFPFNQDAQSYDPSNIINFRDLIQQVYMWMLLGLGTTAGVALVFIKTGLLDNISPLWWIVAFIAQIGIVFAIQGMLNTANTTTLAAMFLVYSAITGMVFSIILTAYEPQAVVSAFATTAALFGIMSVIGYTTSIDLTAMGSLFMMALIGLILAMVVNIFFASPALYFAISIAGVIIFTGLIAYDTQRLKNLAAQAQAQGMPTEMIMKYSVIGALWLYLDFINLFLFLLRLFGNRN